MWAINFPTVKSPQGRNKNLPALTNKGFPPRGPLTRAKKGYCSREKMAEMDISRPYSFPKWQAGKLKDRQQQVSYPLTQGWPAAEQGYFCLISTHHLDISDIISWHWALRAGDGSFVTSDTLSMSLLCLDLQIYTYVIHCCP